MGTTGRFAIVSAPTINPAIPLSEPDVNALTGLDSVQGYGSIVGGTYDDVTGTHDRSSMDPCTLARGVFVPLRLSTIFVLWPSLITGINRTAPPRPVPVCPGALPAGTATTRTFYLGQSYDIASVHLRDDLPGHRRAAPRPALGLRDHRRAGAAGGAGR